jgi:uncharacterized membrane protein YbhN (UPF0104 family)
MTDPADPIGPPRSSNPLPERSAARRFLARRLVPAILAALVLATSLTLVGDARDLVTALRQFRWWLIAPILSLTVWNYGWRFRKWQLYLRHLGIHLPTGLSVRVFLSGFSMSLTPGKVGELVKAVYVQRLTGAPVNRTSAAVAAERITDALAMVILAALGAVEYAYGRPLLGAVAVIGAAGVLLLQRPATVVRWVERMAGLPLVGRLAPHGAAFVDASGSLFRPGILVRAVGLGILSWAGECVAFYLVLDGLGINPSAQLLLAATFILAVSSLAGGASMLPGGLGVADASIAGLLVLLVNDDGMTRSVAAAATILIRFATLWFAVLIGAVALAGLERRLGRAEPADKPLQSSSRADGNLVDRAEPPQGGFEAIGDGGNL